MANQPDGRYDHKPWQQLGPNPTNQERLVTESLDRATALQRRPAIEQVVQFRPRFGYRTRTIGIADIVDIDRIYSPDPSVSGNPAGAEGTSRNTQGTGTW